MSTPANPLAAGVPALQPPSPTVNMVAPNGQWGPVPVEHVDTALAKGFKHTVDMVAPTGEVGPVPMDHVQDAVAKGFKQTGTEGAGAGMKTSAIPSVVRGATDTLPVLGAAAGGAAASPGVVTGAVGAGLGAAGGTEVKQLINRAAFGNEEPATTSAAGLKEAGTNAAVAAGTELAAGALAAGGSKIMGLKAEHLTPPVEPPRPVEPHVANPIPLDDATLGKFDKTLTPEAKAVIRQNVGDTVPAGSSVKNQMVKAVRPINDTIQTQGLALNNILQNSGPLKTNSLPEVQKAIQDLKDNLPGGTEDAFGKAIDKEMVKAFEANKSTDPLEVNQYIRELDKSIKSYTAPEDGIDTPGQAQDAARVTIRRALRDKLNTEIPATKPINTVLGNNLEARRVLQNKLGDIATDPVQAEAQHASELRKGQNYLQYERDAAVVARNRALAAKALAIPTSAAGAGIIGNAAYEKAKKLVKASQVNP